MSRDRSVVLLSGGLDSAVCLALNTNAVALYISYGQPHNSMESEAATRIAHHYSVPLRFASFHLPRKTFDEYDPAMLIPGRNLILLALAATLGDRIVIGANKDDYEIYEDCRPEFFASVPLNIHAPLLSMTKPQIGTLARQFDVPIEMTWSCYYPTEDHEECGHCDACKGAERALP